MAYETVSAPASRTVIITNLIAFAVAEAGFVDEGTTVDGSDTIYHISRTTETIKIFWNVVLDERSVGGDIEYYISGKMSYSKITSYALIVDIGSSGDRQFFRTQMSHYKNNGPYVKSHTFTEGKAVHLVVEVYNNVFATMSLGIADKYGTWNGGEYFQATTTYRDVAAFDNDWDFLWASAIFDGGYSSPSASINNNPRGNYIRHIPGSQQTDQTDFAITGQTITDSQLCRMVVGKYNTSNNILEDLIENASPITFNQRAPLFPIYVRLRDNGTGRYIMKASIPYARVLNINNLVPSDITENEWMVFPVIQKSDGDVSLAPLSNEWGLAFLKDE